MYVIDCRLGLAQEVVDESVVKIPKPQLSRLLYCNPVCILTMRDTNVMHATKSIKGIDERQLYNAMTISWLTPINNHGLFVCSMNSRRYTASLLAETKAGFDAENNHASKFVLSVPTKRLEDLVLKIGSCSGWRHVPPKLGKLRHLGVETCKPGWG